MNQNLPYVTSAGTLEKMLGKITTASVPERFTQDFVSTKLTMKGGTARATIPFIKKLGLVAGDGTPTPLYLEFRNPEKSQVAMAKAMRLVYAPLFEMNESAHNLNDAELKGLIVEATGAPHDSSVVQKTFGTFLALKRMADFDTPALSSTESITDHSTGREAEAENGVARPTEYTQFCIATCYCPDLSACRWPSRNPISRPISWPRVALVRRVWPCHMIWCPGSGSCFRSR